MRWLQLSIRTHSTIRNDIRMISVIDGAATVNHDEGLDSLDRLGSLQSDGPGLAPVNWIWRSFQSSQWCHSVFFM